MLDYKQYFILQVAIITFVLVVVSIINFKIDPAGIYHDTRVFVIEYVDRLSKAEFGLYKPRNSWGERDIKKYLIQKNSGVDCMIIGSSHVMGVSSLRPKRSLTNTCESLLNLGVSGGTIEDYLALSYEIITAKKKPNKVIFGISPWVFDFQRDARWQVYKDSHDEMVELINSGFFQRFSDMLKVQWKLLINLINFEYLVTSLKAITKDEIKQVSLDDYNEIFKEVSASFNIGHGIEEEVTLRDGSLVYTQEYITKAAQSTVVGAGNGYKIKDGSQINKEAVRLFIDLIQQINNIGIEVVFLMTPYHPNVWKDNGSPTKKALLEVEQHIRTLGVDLGVRVLGSYNPYTIKCNSDEFYDGMHAKDSCLSKIVN